MKETKNIEDLLKSAKRDKMEIDLSKTAKYSDVTRKLEEERILEYSDYTDADVRVINVKEDFKEFDYFNTEEERHENKLNEDAKEQLTQDVEETDQIEEEIDIIEEKIENDTPTIIEQLNGYDDTLIEDIFEPEENEKPIVRFEGVGLQFDKDEVIKNIDLSIYKGEFVYFVGQSGAGKSSLAKMIYRDVKNTKGSIYVEDDNISRYNSNKLPKLRRKIGVIFQDFKLLNDRTIYENVNYSLEVTGYPKKNRKEQVLKTLKIVGILDHKDKYPNELSGGQQQRVAIARAIVDEPKIIVADEPTGNLDPQNALVIMDILNKINDSGTTIIMATHDVGIVNKFKKRVVLIKDGEIAKESKGVYIYE